MQKCKIMASVHAHWLTVVFTKSEINNVFVCASVCANQINMFEWKILNLWKPVFSSWRQN